MKKISFSVIAFLARGLASSPRPAWPFAHNRQSVWSALRNFAPTSIFSVLALPTSGILFTRSNGSTIGSARLCEYYEIRSIRRSARSCLKKARAREKRPLRRRMKRARKTTCRLGTLIMRPNTQRMHRQASPPSRRPLPGQRANKTFAKTFRPPRAGTHRRGPRLGRSRPSPHLLTTSTRRHPIAPTHARPRWKNEPRRANPPRQKGSGNWPALPAAAERPR